ncbi:MAG: hypothetical protein K5985_11080 [Lachnospiraceae bacterium]|nr:hypothetical protein [Lachnospiraceae bacterium]
MEFKDVAKSLAQNMGAIEKAQIEILDFRERLVDNELDPVKLNGGGNVGLDPKINKGAATAFADTGMTNDFMVETATMDRKEKPGALQVTQSGPTLEKVKKKLYTVQFNPSSLQLSAHGGGRVQKTKYNTLKDKDGHDILDENGKPKLESGGVSYERASTTISLSVSLLFDAMDIQGAFMSDKFNISPSALIGDLAKTINYNMSKKDENGNKTDESRKKTSVQPEVEGFIGILRNRYTRLITFHWGKMSYTGVLRSVSATYTMFDPLGQPVRAKVDLTIMCADEDIYKSSLNYWRKRYKDIYGKAKDGGISYVKASQMVGNLFNI